MVDDVPLLDRLLRSVISGWLSTHIQHIVIAYRVAVRHPQAFRLLLSGLSGLKSIQYGVYVGDNWSQIIGCMPKHYAAYLSLWENGDTISRGTPFAGALHHRATFNTASRLTHIALHRQHFRSSSTLLRFLGCFLHLDSVQLVGVTWSHKMDSGERPERLSTFPSLRSVETSFCTQNWVLSWMLTAELHGSSPEDHLDGHIDAKSDVAAVAADVVKIFEGFAATFDGVSRFLSAQNITMRKAAYASSGSRSLVSTWLILS